MHIDNTLFLREKFPGIRQYFLDHEKDLDLERLVISQSKSKVLTANYKLNENQEMMIHSSYDPIREAERLIKSHAEDLKAGTHVLFYGAGLGYHIEKFHELYPNLTYSIYEPLPEVLFKVSSEIKLERFICEKMKGFYLDRHDQETEEYLQEFQTENRNIHLIVLPSYENIAKEKKERFLEKIKVVILNRRSSLYTTANFQSRWIINSIVNFKKVLQTPNMICDLDSSEFQGKPAVIVSAGPSLAEDIEYIRYIKEKQLAYVFSVGSAVNTLLSYNIRPDAVFTYDPGEQNHLVFDKMVKQNINDIPMIFGSSVGYETLDCYKGPKVHFITSQDRTSLYLLEDQLDIENDLILDSPSIAVMTFQILNKLGASPIIFAGQNLGYLYDRLYSKGIEYEHISSEIDRDELANALVTLDVYGNEIKTNIGFNYMRESIESFAKASKKGTFINTTKGGAAIEGIPFKPITEVIEEILKRPVGINHWWSKENKYKKNLLQGKRTDLKQSIKDFYIIIEKLDKWLQTIKRGTQLKSKLQVDQSLIAFDHIYAELLENLYYKNFIGFSIRVHVEYITNEIRRINQEPDSFIKAIEITKSFGNFIKQCNTAGKEIEKYIKANIFE